MVECFVFVDSISGATLDGRIATWKRHRESFDLAIDQQWRLQVAFL